MKRVLLLTLGAVLLSGGIAFAQDIPKIGYVDLQRVIRNSKEGKSAKSFFEKDFANKKAIIDQKQSVLDKKKEEFYSKGPVMEEGARADLANDIEKKDKELKRLRADFRDDLKKRDFELTRKILSELEVVLSKFGKKHGYTMIIEKTEGGIVYASPESDLTDQVIKAYDASKK